MTRVVITDPANADLETITHDLAIKAGKAIASRYVEDFAALWEHFVRFPSSGAPRFKFGKGIRSGYVRPYVLCYRYDVAHDIVYVLRILSTLALTGIGAPHLRRFGSILMRL